jgi:hypothetical protein
VSRRPNVQELEAAAELLWRLAADHGMSNLHVAQDPGELVVAVGEGRTYFDIAAFEDEVESRLGWRPSVVPSSAPGARPGKSLTPHVSAA